MSTPPPPLRPASASVWFNWNVIDIGKRNFQTKEKQRVIRERNGVSEWERERERGWVREEREEERWSTAMTLSLLLISLKNVFGHSNPLHLGRFWIHSHSLRWVFRFTFELEGQIFTFIFAGNSGLKSSFGKTVSHWLECLRILWYWKKKHYWIVWMNSVPEIYLKWNKKGLFCISISLIASKLENHIKWVLLEM